MASMSYMHRVCIGPSVLLRTLLACNEIHAVSAFTCEVVADLVSEAGETAGKVCGLIDGCTHITSDAFIGCKLKQIAFVLVWTSKKQIWVDLF